MNRSFPTIIACVAVAALIVPGVVWACMGTPVPPKCSQSAWVAKFVPQTIVNNNATSATIVPINIIPYVLWDAVNDGTCAQPTSAVLNVRLTCTPLGGGGVTALPLQQFSVDTPTSPGAQPVNGIVGGVINYSIPQGTLGAGNFICTIVANYEVSFGVGRGGGVLTGTGDAEVCIVEPSPLDDSLPRLDMIRLDPGDGGFTRCPSGDQAFNHYLITNNDPNNAVALDFDSDNTQIAVMPEHSAQDLSDTNFDPADQTIFAISNPNTPDPFFQMIPTELSPELIPDGDPEAPGVGIVTQNGITIPPLGIEIITVATRSSGMCADGSCTEITARVNGTWQDGFDTPVAACAGTVHFTDSSIPAKSPLIGIEDIICVGPDKFINGQIAVVNFQNFLSTHAVGNNVFQPGVTNVSGEQAINYFANGNPDSPLFDHPQMSTSHLRIIQPPEIIFCSFGSGCVVDPGSNQVQFHQTQVNIENIPMGPLDILIPLIHPEFQPMVPSSLSTTQNIVYNATTDSLKLWDFSQDPGVDDPLIDDTLVNIMKNPPPGFVVDPLTYRRFIIEPPTDGGMLHTLPLATAETVNRNDIAPPLLVDPIVDGFSAPWSATTRGGDEPISLSSSSGPADTPIAIEIATAQVPLPLETIIEWVTVDSPDAINTYHFPVALRGEDGTAPPGIQPGDDFFQSSGCGGQSFVDPLLPTDFFGPGSEPFIGEIRLQGQPLNGGSFGTTDTVIRRLDELDVGGLGGSDTVDIQLVELSLVSCEPIQVTINGADTLWDVEVSLSPSGQQPMGTMTATRETSVGGSFDAVIPFNPILTFTNTQTQDVLEFNGLEKGTGVYNVVIEGAPWSDMCDDPNVYAPTTEVTLPNGQMVQSSGDFFPSVYSVPDTKGITCFCVQTIAFDETAFQLGLTPARVIADSDTDGDGVGDTCDGCPDDPDPLQVDGDNDAIGDACDNCPDIPNSDQADRNNDGEGDACDDEDGDGLTDAEEAECLTDPDEVDSDGDGYWDGFEKDPNNADTSDPNNPNDKPIFANGDLSGDNMRNAVDLQFIILGALSLPVPFPTDVDNVGGTGAVDIQLYINLLLGIIDNLP